MTEPVAEMSPRFATRTSTESRGSAAVHVQSRPWVKIPNATISCTSTSRRRGQTSRLAAIVPSRRTRTRAGTARRRAARIPVAPSRRSATARFSSSAQRPAGPRSTVLPSDSARPPSHLRSLWSRLGDRSAARRVGAAGRNAGLWRLTATRSPRCWSPATGAAASAIASADSRSRPTMRIKRPRAEAMTSQMRFRLL
jgi:hypothetical protein